jgi:hypothetical protein
MVQATGVCMIQVTAVCMIQATGVCMIQATAACMIQATGVCACWSVISSNSIVSRTFSHVLYSRTDVQRAPESESYSHTLCRKLQ